MRLVIQRVISASVNVNNITVSSIGKGIVVLIGIKQDDEETDIMWLVNKILNMRIFDDQDGIMNMSVKDINGEILIVSQFTLYASTKKGNRPSYINAAKSDVSIPLYEKFIEVTKKEFSGKIESGIFGADMKISLINDGPVTIIVDSKIKE